VATYADRADAGRVLAAAIPSVGAVAVVLGLPRGGVLVAAVVAEALGAPLDVVVVHKLGAPGHPELAVGAIAEGGVVVRNERVLRSVAVSEQVLDAAIADSAAEVARRAATYRGGTGPVPLSGMRVLVVDDGIATGATVHAACRSARARGATEVIVAVPVAPPEAIPEVARFADGVICPLRPRRFLAVGSFYRDFRAVGDEEVVAALRRGIGESGTA
jgi:predicted phosphoribosyltransferase